MGGREDVSEIGVSMVEVAIALPLLLALALGGLDCGLLFWNSYQMADAAKQGARQASLIQNFGALNSAQVQNTVTSSLAGYKLLSNVTVSIGAPQDITGDGVSELMVSVSINATYNWSFLRVIGLRSKRLNRSAVRRYEWQADPSP